MAAKRRKRVEAIGIHFKHGGRDKAHPYSQESIYGVRCRFADFNGLLKVKLGKFLEDFRVRYSSPLQFFL